MDTSYFKALEFVDSFLFWYQNSFGQSEVYNHIKLKELVEKAEKIHNLRMKEIHKCFTQHSQEDIKFIEKVAREEDISTLKNTYKVPKKTTQSNKRKSRRTSRHI